MTVIAWDQRILAADSRCTAGSNLVSDQVRKLHKLTVPKNQHYVGGLCGVVGLTIPWLNHLTKNGFGPLNFPNEDWDMYGLFVNRKGEALLASSTGLCNEITYPCAIGSGETVAQHYLNSGATALEAIREAIKSDTGCGGAILVYEYKSDSFTEYPA